MSNDLNQLVQRVEFQKRDPLQRRIVVAQTDGLRHWLSLQLTKRDGIIANIDFFKPNDLVLYSGQLIDARETKDYSVENLKWRIYLILGGKEFSKKFPAIASYFKSDDLRRIQLASKLADLFDQYIIYRTEMVLDWAQDVPVEEQQAWQQWLWKAIKKEIGEDSVDKAAFKDRFLSQLQEPETRKKIAQRLPEIHLFGLSIITKYHLEMIRALSEVVDVYFYFLNPCPEEYWYDCLSEKEIAKKWAKHQDRAFIEESSQGNRMLLSLGKVGQDMFSELLELDDSFINSTEVIYEPNPDKTLLQRIQHEINENMLDEHRESISKELLTDGSLQIAANYTEVRELESLYNHLLDHIIAAEGRVEPQDIVVMVPDIQKYAPYIKAVFDNAPRRLPFTIGDEPLSNTHSVTSFVLEVLNITEGDFTSENILKLLQHKQVQSHYRINDLDVVRSAIRNCNIRFGIEGNRLLETDLVSWVNGIKRIVFGIAMRDDVFNQGTDNEVFPYDLAEGSVTQDLLRFVNFVEDLILQIKISQRERSIKEWTEFVLNVIHTFIEENSDNEEEFITFRKKLSELSDIEEHFGEFKLPHRVFLFVLKDFQQNEVLNEGYFRGRITFCTALPMRSIPFKMVAFLGLNADAFPRKNTSQAFDLIQNSKRKRGDRNIKDNDRYLFLEALLSARESVYLSYIGASVKNNKAKNPSILIDELVDYLQLKTDREVDVSEALVQYHPLHRYSKRYLQSETGLSTYFPIDEIQAKQFLSEVVSEHKDNVSKEIELSDLLYFYSNPARHFVKNQVGVSYFELDNQIPATEVFDLDDTLQSYQMNQALFEVKPTDLPAFIREQKVLGNAPLGKMGEVLLQDRFLNQIEAYQTAHQSLVQDKDTHKEQINLSLGDFTLSGEIDNVYEEDIVDMSFSKSANQTKRLFPLYLKLLCLRAKGLESNAHLVHKQGIEKLTGNAIPEEKANEVLTQLIQVYLEHQDQPLPFYPRISAIALEEEDEGKFKKKLYGSDFSPGVVTYDEYTALLDAKLDLWSFDTVYEWANRILADMNQLILKDN